MAYGGAAMASSSTTPDAWRAAGRGPIDFPWRRASAKANGATNSDECERAEFHRHGRAAERHREKEVAALAGVAEPPDRGQRAEDHGGQEILDEQGAGDELHDRRSGERSGQQIGGVRVKPRRRSAIEQAADASSIEKTSRRAAYSPPSR